MIRALPKVPVEVLCRSVTSGGTPSRSNTSFWEGGTVPWFKTGELKDWYVEDSEEKITEDGLAQSAAKLFPPNTILMAMYGDGKTITSLGILRKQAATNQACCAMIADESKCDFLYLFYALKHHRNELLQLVVAGAQRNLSGGIIRSFKITGHPLPAQRRIASILSAYDDLMENNRRRMGLLEEAARQLYREWFVRLRFPGHQRTKITNGLPAGWHRTTLGDLFTLKRGHDLPASERLDGPIPIVSSAGITGYHAEKKCDPPGVVTGRYGTLGEVYYLQEPYWPLNTALYVSDFKGTPALFAAHLLRHLLSGRQSDKAAVPGLDRNVAHQLQVLRPPDALRDEFNGFADACYRQRRLLELQNQHLRRARDLLLPRLMSGEITV